MAAGRNMVSGPLLAKTRDLQTGPYDSEVSSDTGAEGALVISHPGSGTALACGSGMAGSLGGGFGRHRGRMLGLFRI